MTSEEKNSKNSAEENYPHAIAEEKSSPSWLPWVRWTFTGFCVVIFGFSLALLILSSIGHSQMRTAFDELETMKYYDLKMKQEDFLTRFRPEKVTFFYFKIPIKIFSFFRLSAFSISE